MMKGFLVALLVFFMVYQVQAQKVGLVLSGGGSKGVAHIGVIQALEESGIPIDYVAGTSMGAIIGGLYASGYSPEEMKTLVNSEEFSEWVDSDISKKYRYYYKQLDPDASRIKLQYSLSSQDEESSLSIPLNVVKPYQMDFAIMENFSPASAVAGSDFNDLFVPFRCVAADVTNNKPVVFSEGDLGTAIRASMSFPFYFKPITVDGRVMFDGGMYNNFPKDVMQNDFNPDYLIGSKVSSNYGPPKVNDIISQLQTMLMENTVYDIDSAEGVLIDPNIPPTNITDFSNTEAYIDSGYFATLEYIDSIRQRVKRVLPADSMERKRARFHGRQKPFKIGEVIPRGVDQNEKQYIINSFRQRIAPGSSIDVFKEEYFKLVADRRINYAYPVAKLNDETGFYDITLEVEKLENIEVSLGGNVSSDAINEAFVKANYNHFGQPTFSAYGQSYIGRFYSAGHLGLRLDNAKTFPFYLRGALSYNQWDYFETSTYFFEDKQPSYLIQDDQYFSLDLGIPAGLSSVVSIGGASGDLDSEYYQQNNFTRTDTADLTEFDYLTHWLKYEFNTLNKKYYASKGSLITLKLQRISGEEHYESGSTAPSEFERFKQHRWYAMKLRVRHFFPDLYVSRWGVHLEGIYSNQNNFTNYTSSALVAPAFEPIPASRTRFYPSYRSYSYAAAGLINITQVNKNTDIRLEGYVFAPYRKLRREEFEAAGTGDVFADQYIMATGAFVFHSPIGPVSLSVNYFQQAEDKLSIVFNFGYMLFNRQPLKW
ncbi:MAG: patatin-like phospholipase family protein [Bacteroidota bacterium]